MAMCVQGLLVTDDGAIPSCPRLAGVAVQKCRRKCKYYRGGTIGVTVQGELPTRVEMERFLTVLCAHKNTREAPSFSPKSSNEVTKPQVERQKQKTHGKKPSRGYPKN